MEALVVWATDRSGGKERFIVPNAIDLEVIANSDKYKDFRVTDRYGKDTFYKVELGQLHKIK